MQAFLGAAGLEVLGGLALDFLDLDDRVGGLAEGLGEEIAGMRGEELEFARAALGGLRRREVFLGPADAVHLDLDDHAAALAHEGGGLSEGLADGAGGEGGFCFVEENAHLDRLSVSAGGPVERNMGTTHEPPLVPCYRSGFRSD